MDRTSCICLLFADHFHANAASTIISHYGARFRYLLLFPCLAEENTSDSDQIAPALIYIRAHHHRPPPPQHKRDTSHIHTYICKQKSLDTKAARAKGAKGKRCTGHAYHVPTTITGLAYHTPAAKGVPACAKQSLREEHADLYIYLQKMKR